MTVSDEKYKEIARNCFPLKPLAHSQTNLLLLLQYKYNPLDFDETYMFSELLQKFCQGASLPVFLKREVLHAVLASAEAKCLIILHTLE